MSQLSPGVGEKQRGEENNVFCWLSWKQYLISCVSTCVAREQLILLIKPVLQRTAFPAEGVPDKTAILSKLDTRLPGDARGMLQPLLFENFPK